MLLLGIDTASERTSVALRSDEGVLGSLELRGRSRHAEQLVPALSFLLEQNGLEPRSLTGVAVGLGPGLLSGLRVGVATAKAAAQALSLPLVGLPSLDVLAFAFSYVDSPFIALLNAGRGEVFWAWYQPCPGGVLRDGEYTLSSPEAVCQEVTAADRDVLCVGTGAWAYRELFLSARPGVQVSDEEFSFPSARYLLELARPRFERGEFDSLFELEPIYLRQAAGPIQWQRLREGRSA